ncbi:uncharacterized protein ACBT44_001265 isoform 2-T5 [Syngnathus typhle]
MILHLLGKDILQKGVRPVESFRSLACCWSCEVDLQGEMLLAGSFKFTSLWTGVCLESPLLVKSQESLQQRLKFSCCFLIHKATRNMNSFLLMQP